MVHFRYKEGMPVMLGDRVRVDPSRLATVTKIIVPNSDEAIAWDIPEGGVLFDIDDGDCLVTSDLDEDFELVSRKGE